MSSFVQLHTAIMALDHKAVEQVLEAGFVLKPQQSIDVYNSLWRLTNRQQVMQHQSVQEVRHQVQTILKILGAYKHNILLYPESSLSPFISDWGYDEAFIQDIEETCQKHQFFNQQGGHYLHTIASNSLIHTKSIEHAIASNRFDPMHRDEDGNCPLMLMWLKTGMQYGFNYRQRLEHAVDKMIEASWHLLGQRGSMPSPNKRGMDLMWALRQAAFQARCSVAMPSVVVDNIEHFASQLEKKQLEQLVLVDVQEDGRGRKKM